MDEFLNACAAWPSEVSIENPTANQVTWPTTLLLARVYTKVPLFGIQHHYKSTEYRKEITKQRESWEKANLVNPPCLLLWVLKNSRYIAVLTSDINVGPQGLSGIYMLSNLASLFLMLGLGFTKTASSAIVSQGKEEIAW